jgi:hypothetical protein
MYVLIPAGIEPDERRAAALAIAGRLAPHAAPAAVLVVEHGRVDAHVMGEVPCGRAGPGSLVADADPGRAFDNLLRQCDQVSVIMLDPPDGLLVRLGPAARQTVFVATADRESVVETYRAMKAWRADRIESEPGVLVVGPDGDPAARGALARLDHASRAFLGCDLAMRGTLALGPDGVTWNHAEPLKILSAAPLDALWPRLAQGAGASLGAPDLPLIESSPQAPGSPPRLRGASSSDAPCPSRDREGASPLTFAAAGCAAVCPAFAWWRPETREDLLAAIESQAPDALPGRLRRVFRMEVDEPGAPPLAAVRDDGALVAVLMLNADCGLQNELPAPYAPGSPPIESAPGAPGSPPRLRGASPATVCPSRDREGASPSSPLASEGEGLGARGTPFAGAAPFAALDTRAAEAWLARHARLLARAYPSAGIRPDAAPASIVLAPYAPPPRTDGIRRFIPVRMGGHRGVILLP